MSEKTPTFQNKLELSRRNILKLSFAALATSLASGLSITKLAHAAQLSSQKPLIVYYSRTGNTRTIAEQINKRISGEIVELRTAHSYPEAYRATTDQARKELDSNFRPELTVKINNMDDYKTIFIGYPNWWGTLPMAFFTFFESYNFAGKTLVPFCTHEGSGLGRGPSDIAKLCPSATVATGLAIRGGRVSSALAEVDSWLDSLRLV